MEIFLQADISAAIFVGLLAVPTSRLLAKIKAYSGCAFVRIAMHIVSTVIR